MKTLTILLMGAIMMSGCGGSSATSTDTTAAPVETSATATETSVAASDTTPPDAEQPPAEAALTSETETGAAQATPGIGSMDQLLTTLGVSDPKDVACIQDRLQALGTTVPSSADASVDPNLIRVILICQPPTVVQLAQQQFSTRFPELGPEQATCAVKTTLTGLAKAEDIDFGALAGGPSAFTPALRSELAEPLKVCGLSDAQLAQYIGTE